MASTRVNAQYDNMPQGAASAHVESHYAEPSKLHTSATYDDAAQLARDAAELVESPAATLHYADVWQLPSVSATPIYARSQIVKSMSELGPSFAATKTQH